MNKILSISLLLSTMIFANINAVVSILPEKTFVEAIGGEKVSVSLMVLPGASPHTYEPKPSQMKDVAKASLYFAIGVEFEKVWLDKFKSINPSMKVIDLSQGIKKLPMAAHHHDDTMHHEEEANDKTDHEKNLDPHIWTAPKNVQRIAINIFKALSDNDPENRAYYKKNYDDFIEQIQETDAQIKEILRGKAGTKFMVFHPSWGYFAQAYVLQQLAVELEGKSPKPKELVALIKEAREEHVKAIFTQPEFSDSIAKVMAKELQIEVVKVSPLSADWSANLIRIAKAIANEPQEPASKESH